MNEKYFAITWNLDVIDLGHHTSFEAADSYANSKNIEVPQSDILYIVSSEQLNHLQKEIEKANS